MQNAWELVRSAAALKAVEDQSDDSVAPTGDSTQLSRVQLAENDRQLDPLAAAPKIEEAVTSEQSAQARPLDELQAELQALKLLAESEMIDPPAAPGRLIELIKSGADLNTSAVRNLAAAVEEFMLDIRAEKVATHRDIGRAIFARSSELYNGRGLPSCLVRYTYPALLSLLLNTHCNAACFFCREADYKGTSVEYDNILKLAGPIRHARVIDLTGWGEPFLYPNFERVVEYVLGLNSSPQMIFVTTNGSLLSQKWGRLLSGKIFGLVISVNAGTSVTYDAQMRFKNNAFTFDRLITNLREFLPALTDEDRKRLDLHMVANTGNFREISNLVAIAGDLGIPVVSVGHYICGQPEHMDKVLWNVKNEYNDELSRARELGERLGVRVHGRSFFVDEVERKGAANCLAPFEQIFIETTGKTAPCCYMGNERIGRVYDDGFEAVWFSDTMTKLRQDRYLPPCQVCTVFSPFDEKTTHISATLLTKATGDLEERDITVARRSRKPS